MSSPVRIRRSVFDRLLDNNPDMPEGLMQTCTVEQLRDAVGFVVNNHFLRRSLAERSRQLVDGRGAERVAAALAETPYADLADASMAVEVAVRLSDDAEVHTLNRQYRDKDKPTPPVPVVVSADGTVIPADAAAPMGFEQKTEYATVRLTLPASIKPQTRSRSASLARPQATISSMLRQQPSHRPLAGNMRHTPTQGEGTAPAGAVLRARARLRGVVEVVTEAA